MTTRATTERPARGPALARAAMESLILALTALAPWAFGAVHPASMLLLDLGLAAALVLWSLEMALAGRSTPRLCPVLFCLCGMVALGIGQLAPLDSKTLSSLSAATAAWRSDLFPRPLESVGGAEAPAPASTLSLDAGATRRAVVDLLTALAVFAVVRFAVASPAAFRRLAIVCVFNGSLLSLFALAQRFSSAPDLIYWRWPVQGSCYGPFVCRNHFPDYVNVCLFLGAGLLLDRPAFRLRELRPGERLLMLGRDTAAQWLIFALAVMTAGVLFSFSRGGALALAAAACCATVLARAARFRSSFPLLACVGVAAVGMVSWFGADAVEQRLGTLAQAAPDSGRREVWLRTLALVGRFPLFGTGLGTFYTVEPQTRQPGDAQSPNWEHAHNDYLEALVEGGVVNFALALAAVGFVCRESFRSLDRARAAGVAGLVVGGLCGFVAVTAHSVGDFGMHIPAVALLTIVLAAHLTAMRDLPPTAAPARSRLWIAPLAGACLTLACVLPVDAWLRERADHYRRAALRAQRRLSPGDRLPVVHYLEAAVRFTPDDALIRLRLAEARYEEYQAQGGKVGASDAARTMLEEQFLRPALGDYLALRSLNPLYEQPHARLAAHRNIILDADTVQAYLERATRLRPTDEALWYYSGLNRLHEGDCDRAWQDWKRSLTCSRAHLPEIVSAALARIGPEGLVDHVLPTNPQLLLEASRTEQLAAAADLRRLFAERALGRLAETTLTSGEDNYVRAYLLRLAGRKPEAVAAYDAVLLRRPEMVEWRFEFAELLVESRDWKAAEKQLSQVLRERPDLADARELNMTVLRARAGGQ